MTVVSGLACLANRQGRYVCALIRPLRVKLAEKEHRPVREDLNMNRFVAILLCVLVSDTTLPGGPQFEAGPVEARIVSGPSEDGNLFISIKVVVTNYSDEELALDLSIQGCDSDGFELAEFELEGKVKARTTNTITDTDYIEADIYESISNWRIEE